MAAGLLALIIVGWTVVPYLLQDPEVRTITQLVESARQAVLHKDVAACLELIDETYTDNFNHTYERVRENVGRKFEEVSDLKIRLRNLHVEIDKAKGLAMAKFEMRATGRYDDGTGRKIPFIGVRGEMQPFSPNWETVTLLYAKRDSRWLVTRLYIEAARR